MKKITIAILLICMLSFVVSPVLAAPDTTIITPKAKAANQLEEHVLSKISEQAKTHNPVLFTNEVPGVGGLRYEGEQVPKGFEHVPETVTMVSWHNEGRLHIRDTNHKTVTIQVPWATLQEIEGFDGEHVRVWHYDDSGVCDGKWVQTVSNEGGYAYLEEVPFSEVIVGGYTGTYSKVETEIDITDTINLGRTFDSEDVSSLTLEFDDQYSSKTDPYDINTTGLVCWLKLDNDFIDSSDESNNGTATNTSFGNGKYNNGCIFNKKDSVVSISDTDTLELPQYTISFDMYPYSSGELTKGVMIQKDNVNGYYVFVSNEKISIYSNGVELGYGSRADIYYNEWQHVSVAFDGTNCIIYNNLQKYTPDVMTPGTFSTGDLLIGNRDDGDRTFDGIIDNVLIYNRSLSESEIKELYYISASSIQAKTNSHAEYSTEWNSSADNPLSVPYGASESISSITFNQPESIEQNGVTIYDPINVLMNVTATMGYTEDIYLIEEFCNEGFYVDQYAIEITHTPSASNANGEISYNPTDSLCSEIMGKTWTYELTTDNPNASITTFNKNSLVIDTGAIVAGTEYSYVVTAETTDEVANTTLETDISSAIQLSGILPMLLIAASILGLLMGMLTGNIEFDTAVKSVGVVIFLSVVLYVGIAILNTIATALG